MGFKCGIIGLPNVGKSTLFNALTKISAAAENYPFCTIDPNVGIVPVPDDRLKKLAEIVNPKEIIPAFIEFIDIAGLVKGAAEGEGLGNQFLGNIRETDAVAHVVRCFKDPNVVHVSGKVDPVEDIAIVNMELILADLETVERSLIRVSKHSKTGDKTSIAEKATLEKIRAHLNAGHPARELKRSESETIFLKQLCLLTDKSVLYVANVAEDGLTNNPFLEQMTLKAKQENAKLVVLCVAVEAELAMLQDEEKQEFLVDLGIQEPALNKLIRAGYELLGLQTFFTAGPKEVHAWTIPKGTLAKRAAGRIHTDFEKGFIRAEIVSYEDFIKYKGEIKAKASGKWRLEGKDYVMQDGDIVHFRFSV